MAGKGNVSIMEQSGRISACAEITDLTTGFSLGNNKPFSLFIIPNDESQTPVIVNCTLYQSDANTNVPFTPNVWDVPYVSSIEIAGIDTTLYSIYYGVGYEL